jgi:hypothetical protein
MPDPYTINIDEINELFDKMMMEDKKPIALVYENTPLYLFPRNEPAYVGVSKE